jgi:hypothetical protein
MGKTAWDVMRGVDLEGVISHAQDTMSQKTKGGQVQRMLVRGAELLVIDGLSSALDVETEHALWERISEREDATAWSSRTDAPPCNGPITSSFSRMAGSTRKGGFPSC